MNLNDLFAKSEIDPRQVLVLRHSPPEPELRKVLPWLAAERHDLFNAYQQTQRNRLEGVMEKMTGSGYVASFIERGPGAAIFVGLYTIDAARPLDQESFWNVPEYIEMKAYGFKSWNIGEQAKPYVLWFELTRTDFYSDWKGRLVVEWPPPERSWWRRAHKNVMPVIALHEESLFDAAMPGWDELNVTWEELTILPRQWKSALSEWRGIYYIFDTSDGKGYVGTAYGAQNLLGRWLDYAASGHGGNRLLRQRNPRNFRFTILQRVSPDMDVHDVVRLESSWKQRLHTHKPQGLNDN